MTAIAPNDTSSLQTAPTATSSKKMRNRGPKFLRNRCKRSGSGCVEKDNYNTGTERPSFEAVRIRYPRNFVIDIENSRNFVKGVGFL
mmetsp:Transcript_14237/g.22415  ORF Transcript_14237/g.22415 Transcript_14237/m.22415 type:complete len:87 (+) Transcript_14237:439-699(+)|eukprot:CAMPEP_0201605244 /NCGR_PEP_ID=MMETSP0492-20130828/5135_1 /ASSEMBLY_ACC=CAM_ASM_000837 /TAXON_ID=420259 /ORGANISM="Thalassiosira gravida, Strain GMp14c1" /LENGTH=86 /DNA_ID=CAMNT_0048069459 /DNA_START=398 /DNA_END=658 /DNA_ORIENTATION=-